MTVANTAEDRLFKAVNLVHRTIVTVSGGRLGNSAANLPVVKLTELWPRIATGDKGFAAYQKKTDRTIPVVICERPS